MTQTAKSRQSIAGIHELGRIEGSWSSYRGVSALPITVRPWIYWLLALIKLGYREIRAPVWAITKSQAQSCARTTSSRRSTFRALRWLEDMGYITRRQLRINQDCHGLILQINTSRFKFYTLSVPPPIPTSVVIKHTEMCDSYLQVPTWHSDDFRSNNNKLSVSKSNIDTNCLQSKTHANKNQGEKSTHKFHPIIYTLMLVTENLSDRAAILRRARAELAGGKKSAIDWKYWARRWTDFSHTERESYARRELIPALRKKHPKKTINTTKKDRCDMPADTIQKFVSAICDHTEITTEFADDMLNDEEKKELAEAQKKLMWARKNMNFD